MTDIPLSLYVHFPWCIRKCPYCDFNSHALDGDLPEDAYIDALIADLMLEAGTEPRRNLESIFLGGGTPSLFSPNAISRLITAIGEHFDVTRIEITIEANPGTFDQSRFEGYRRAGVNRISIGAQSFNADQLQKLGRIHQAADIDAAVSGARRAGFERINLDLMHSLPGQTTEEALADLDHAISLEPEHLSWYQLTIEPNTVFYSQPPTLPEEEITSSIMEQGIDRLTGAGYRQYEVSAFARPGEKAMHNLNYWLFGDYLGIGAGAHGKLTRHDRVLRTTRTRMPGPYLQDPGRKEQAVATNELTLEFLMNALRLNEGFDPVLFTERTGLAIDLLDPFLEKAAGHGLLEVESDRIQPTPRGHRFLNDLLLLI